MAPTVQRAWRVAKPERRWDCRRGTPTRYNWPSSSRSPCWCIDVFMEQLRWTVAHKQPTSSVVNICGPPVCGSWSLCVFDWTVMDVGVLLLWARRPGIRGQTVSVTQH